jgi:hypothetical protein
VRELVTAPRNNRHLRRVDEPATMQRQRKLGQRRRFDLAAAPLGNHADLGN